MTLEIVQRHAAEYILQDYSLNYKTRLTSLNLVPLMYRLELQSTLFFGEVC